MSRPAMLRPPIWRTPPRGADARARHARQCNRAQDLAVAVLRAVCRLAVFYSRPVVRSCYLDPALLADGLCVRGRRFAAAAGEIAARADALVFASRRSHCSRSAISGILLAPHLSIHLATDLQEPGLAGNWRGSFGHKNMAAGIMAMLLFFGIYFIRAGAWIAGVSVDRPGLAVPDLFRRQKLVDALLRGAAADVADICSPLVLGARRHAADAAGAAEHAQRRHRDER